MNNRAVLKLFMLSVLWYPCLMVTFVKILSSPGILERPLYVSVQFGFGKIPLKGFELDFLLLFLKGLMLSGSFPVYAARNAGITTSCAYLPYPSKYSGSSTIGVGVLYGFLNARSRDRIARLASNCLKVSETTLGSNFVNRVWYEI